ncbi:MAG: hypothetical protein L3J71_08460 [Victivallaceae bacterium]|nr:hypothetical protein [Victivallaceae bacterium]
MNIKKINPFRKKVKLRYKLLATAGIFIAGLMLFSLIILSMIFSHKPNFQMTPISGDDMSTGTQIVNKIFSQVLIKRKKHEIDTITLTEKEVNAIIQLVANSKNIADIYLGRPPDIIKRPWQATYRNGQVDISFCATIKQWTPFGSKINIKATAIPTITAETVSVEVLSAAAGSFSIPNDRVEQLATKEIEKQRNKKWYKSIRKIIVKITINDDGTLTIYYRPYQLRKLTTKLLFRWK